MIDDYLYSTLENDLSSKQKHQDQVKRKYLEFQCNNIRITKS